MVVAYVGLIRLMQPQDRSVRISLPQSFVWLRLSLSLTLRVSLSLMSLSVSGSLSSKLAGFQMQSSPVTPKSTSHQCVLLDCPL